MAGNSTRYVEKKSGVPRTSVRRATALIAQRAGAEKRKQIGDMLLELVAETVEGGIRAARLLSDDKYIKTHSPSEVAILSGTLMDKAFLILAAAERYQLGSGEGDGDGEPVEVVEADEPAVDVQAAPPSDPDSGPAAR